MNTSEHIGELASAKIKLVNHKNFIDLSGQRFGDWTVLERGPNSKKADGKSRFLCQCVCGFKSLILSCNLTTGKSSCCFTCSRKKRKNYHGKSNSKTYSVYIQMKERCCNKKHKCYEYYGARGITVCSRWLEGFSFFLEDMGEAPEGLSLDRIDNDKGYSKENCRWTTKKEQQRNRRNSITIGEINNGWIVKERLPSKSYLITCSSCGFSRRIRSCNVRLLSGCKH